MQDNELYNYFIKNKHRGDEMPSDKLWSKIEGNLQAAAPSATVTSQSSLKILIFAAATVIIATGVTIFYLSKSSPRQFDLQKKQILAPEKPAVVEEIVKELPATAVYYDTVKPKKFKAIAKKSDVKPIDKQPVHQFEDEPAPAKTNKVAFKTFTRAMSADEIAAADSISFNVNNVVTKTSKMPDRILVQTSQKLTKSQFIRLVTKVIGDNKDEAGKILVVRAPGHNTYKHVILPDTSQQIQLKPESVTIATDSLTLKPTEIKLSDSIKNNVIIERAYYKKANTTDTTKVKSGKKSRH